MQGEWNERIKPTIFWKRVIYSWTRVARNERIERIERDVRDVRDQRNERNERDVRKERDVRNERDERIWRNAVFVFRAKRLRRIEGALYLIEASKAQV